MMTINDWIDAEILRQPVTDTVNGQNLISTYAAAEIARGAALRIIADKPTLIQNLVTECHEASRRNGFYNDRKTGEPMERNVGELIALCHSELSEMLEAYRKDLDSKHIPGFTGETEECVDLIIRAFDLAGYRKLPIGTAYVAKRAYNDVREDHKNEARRQPGGKKF